MPLMFNSILSEAGIPLEKVRLLRHQDQRAVKGFSPYELWRDDRQRFELYQSHQSFGNRIKIDHPYWASFVGTPSNETLFVGIYSVCYKGVLANDIPAPHTHNILEAGSCDAYELSLLPEFADLDGKLYIDWGLGTRSWIQRADNKNKPITEIRTEFKEPDFPGFLQFVSPLSKLDTLPPGWISSLKATSGVYLLTCPKTKEQYVGSAYGKDGFWGRWQRYIIDGHGGNIALKSRDPSDYQVCILETAGTALTSDEIIHMESLWKAKLQSREMGLNRN
ncbi:GIY-YIG nuclease family protein [Gimesia sp.]|uniref:GIY-YIG nuclease family protein n=1 Tax=Gimesia sp. TaxID=2024833 RepID=UPI003A8E2346